MGNLLRNRPTPRPDPRARRNRRNLLRNTYQYLQASARSLRGEAIHLALRDEREAFHEVRDFCGDLLGGT